MREGSPFMGPFQAPSSAFSSDSTCRQRFQVELKEPNVVSWKKLMKSAPPPPPAAEPPPGANPALEARLAPEAVLFAREQRGSAPSRFSEVIEKIERLYQGQGQESDDDIVENQLDNVPDDDQYNTDDSFIDDKDLDEYFCVERAKTVHSGFFINKGKLENITDPSPPPVAVPKKRKRKEAGGNRDPQDSLKKVKKENVEEEAYKVGECLVNKQAETQGQDDCRPAKACDQKKASAKAAARLQSSDKNRLHCNGAGVGAGKSVISSSPSKVKQMPEKDSCKLSLAPPVPGNENPQKRAAPKITLLERAILDLKAGVAQLQPSVPEVQEAEQGTSAPGKTRRLPREIKQKIAKVARLAAKQGKIPDELINRLMSILGHLMQLKTLKRNLKEMVEMGLVAKQEKEGRFIQMKREFTEMVRSRVSSMQAKAEEGSQGDFEGMAGSGDKRCYYRWDQATEDRVCDLYDHYLEGTDENKGVQSRKLYIELAELWPEGWMDKDGIKNAVYRAKERRKALHKQSLHECRKKISSERIDLNARLPEATSSTMPPGVNLSLSRDLPSNSIQTGKPAVIRKEIQRGSLLEKLSEPKEKEKKRLSGEAADPSELGFFKFRKQKGEDDTGSNSNTNSNINNSNININNNNNTSFVPRFISKPASEPIVVIDGTG